MAAYAALVSLLNNIHAIMKHPTLSTALLNQPIQPILEKTNFLLDFIEGYKYGAGSKEAQDLERQIAAAAHAAEDLIESHIVDLIEAKTDLVCSLDLKQSIQDMDAVMGKATKVKKKWEVKEEKSTHLAVARPLKVEGESAMVGLDAELNHLLDELTGYQSSRCIISIVAMGGAGKTTLAKNIYENLLIKEHFQFRAWTTVSEQHNALEVLSQLLSIRGEMSKVDDLGKQLYQTLFGRRYLIIMDDIWSVKAWDEVKHFFPDNNNASRILLTTRLSNVAKECCSSLFMMNLLDKANSWKLFCEKAFPNEDCPPELREVGEEIVKLCKGLALSIVVIGGLLLKSPKCVRYWYSVAEDLKSTLNSKEKQESLDVLSLSYHHLPPHLKPCFLYMGVFEEDSRIRVFEIVNLWVAEGFIKPIGSQVLEEIAEGYIKDLIDRNLILVLRYRKNGKFGYLGIHDLLRDLSIKLAEQEEFFHLIQGGVRGTERRLIGVQDVGWKELNLPPTRSIIMTEGRITPSPQYKLLRVSNAFHFKSPTDYANVNLRYVASWEDYVRCIPTTWKLHPSLNHSWNFQTLIIRANSNSSIILLPDFWNLRQLRHMRCYRMYIPDPPRSNREDGMLMLHNLQTLKTTMNLRLSEEVCKFIPNIKKLHLSYVEGKHGYDDSLIEHLCNLHRLHKLESLQLNLYELTFPNRELVKKLTSSFPRSLKKSSLKVYKLEWDDMTMIGSLPQLEVLQLSFIVSKEGKRWSPVDEQFLQLKYLKIHSCDLVSWDTDDSHFPVLQKLHLVHLESLDEIPLGIGDISTLQLICVEYCNMCVAISAVRIKEDQLDNGGQLQVQLRMCDDEVEGFNQMLETEGLTISNIDLDCVPYYKVTL